MAQESTQRLGYKKGVNPVQTGLAQPAEVAQRVLEAIGGWKDSDRKSVLLLKTLAELTREKKEESAIGFIAIELYAKAGNQNQVDPETARRWVSKYWNELKDDILPAKQEGLQQVAVDMGLTWQPGIDKTEGGGAGRPSRYRLMALPLQETGSGQSISMQKAVPDHIRQTPDTIRYICENREDLGRYWGRLAEGWTIEGWRLVLFLSTLMLFILAGALFAWFISAVALHSSTILQLAKILILGSVILGFAWWNLGPLILVLNRRIVPAPWWLSLMNEERLLELRRPPRYPERRLVVTRYTGTCPVCGGKVWVSRRHWHLGSFLGKDRLIGRCDETPLEHTFSFDHVMKEGRRLDQ